MGKDSLGDRIKRYERVYDSYMVRNMPVVVRVDGKAFHTYTKGFERPFSKVLIAAMQHAACCVCKQIQGFKIAYIQSDEATFVFTDYDKPETDGWFDYRVNKINSIASSIMSVNFNDYMWNIQKEIDMRKKVAYFDARSFNVPEHDIANVLLWRMKDWERNSLQMYCRSFFSQKEMHGKKTSDMHEMLHKIGKNWAIDLQYVEKNGTLFYRGEEGQIIQTQFDQNYEGINGIFKDAIENARNKKD